MRVFVVCKRLCCELTQQPAQDVRRVGVAPRRARVEQQRRAGDPLHKLFQVEPHPDRVLPRGLAQLLAVELVHDGVGVAV